VGLAQREIEAAGLSTLSLSPIAAFTASVGAPRVAAIEHPGAVILGRPGDAEGQTAVLRAALQALERMDTPGAVEELPFVWPEEPRRARYHPPRPPPIVKLLRRKPWLLLRLLSRSFPR
jgi:hypothetical protein